MSKNDNWQRVSRLELLDSAFLKVYQDRVRLPNGSERDYFLTKKADIVIVVATTGDGEVVMIDEYKYAALKYMTVLPAGHIEAGEDPTKAAKRELSEETGYEGKTYEYLGQLFESPVQDLHRIEVVRVKNVSKKTEISHEDSEDIKTHLILVEELKKKISAAEIQSCSTLGALLLADLI